METSANFLLTFLLPCAENIDTNLVLEIQIEKGIRRYFKIFFQSAYQRLHTLECLMRIPQIQCLLSWARHAASIHQDQITEADHKSFQTGTGINPASNLIRVYGSYPGQKSGFGGLEVACWPLVPKFASSHPTEAVEFLGRKNPQHAFLRRGSKAVGPMSQLYGM